MLTIIVAKGKNNEIGKDNDLIWHLKEDLQFFKEHTTNKIIIMGSNTFYSLPHLLPNRKHIVLTLDDYKFPDEVEVYNDFEVLLKYLKTKDEDMYVIGGAAIYHLFINYVDKMLITEIDHEFDADKFFPRFNKKDWKKRVLSKHKDNGLKYSHVEYTRKVKR